MVEQPAYIQCVGGSSPSAPISKAKFFHFPFPFTKVIRQKNGTMAAVEAILKCHHNGTFLRTGEGKSHRCKSGRSDSELSVVLKTTYNLLNEKTSGY